MLEAARKAESEATRLAQLQAHEASEEALEAATAQSKIEHADRLRAQIQKNIAEALEQ